LILMDESMPVLQLLWEIGVALLVLRLAFIYYGLTFLTRCVLRFIRIGILVRFYGIREPMAGLFEMLFMLLAVTLWAKFIVAKFKIPKVAWVRLAVGLVGLVFILVTEFVGTVIMYEEGPGKGLLEDLVASGALATSLAIFGLMPWIMMLLDGNELSD
jgi:hypothetical protein